MVPTNIEFLLCAKPYVKHFKYIIHTHYSPVRVYIIALFSI